MSVMPKVHDVREKRTSKPRVRIQFRSVVNESSSKHSVYVTQYRFVALTESQGHDAGTC